MKVLSKNSKEDLLIFQNKELTVLSSIVDKFKGKLNLNKKTSKLYLNSLLDGQPWKQQYLTNKEYNGDIVGWKEGPNLPECLSNASVVVVNNKVYFFGGYISGESTSNIYVSSITENGELGGWSHIGSLPETLSNFESIVIDNKIYIIGGSSLNFTYVVHINKDGSLSEWEYGPKFPIYTSSPQIALIKNKVYVMGGLSEGGVSRKIYYSTIDSFGYLGEWKEYRPLKEPLACGQVAIIGNKLYILGGYNNINILDKIYVTTIDENGELGEWSIYGRLPKATCESQVVVTNKTIHVLNFGIDPIAVFAEIKDDFSIGEWVNGTPLPKAMAYSQAAVVNSRIYMIGGFSWTYTCTVFSAPFKGV